MPLSISTIEASIQALLESTENLQLEQAQARFKRDLTIIIVNAIKSATITIPPAAIVTTGSAATQTNASPVVVQGGLT